MLRLIVLGGSAASPNTGAGCSGYLITTASTRILIDPGPGTLQELRRWTDFRTLSAVIVSHMHLDHMLDLLALRHALAYNPIPVPDAIPVWLPPGGSEFLSRATAPFDACDKPGVFDETVRVGEFDPSEELLVGDIGVRFAPTVHFMPCWAMRFDSEQASIGYTADGGPDSDLVEFFARVDVLLAEATLLEHKAVGVPRRSLTSEDAGALAASSGAGRLILTHYWEEHGSANHLSQASAVYPGPVDLARPGLTIDVASQ